MVNIASSLREAAVSAFRTMVSGIGSALSGLYSVVSNGFSAAIRFITGLPERIRSFLHFTAPDEGPLADYESWMPDFMEGLAKGIERNRGLVEKAVRDVASDMVLSPKVNGVEYGAMESPLSGGNIVIPVYVGGTLLDELVVTAQARQNLRSGGR